MLWTRRAALTASIGLVAASGLPALAQAVRRWNVSGTASTNSSGPENPYYVLGNASVQDVVYAALEGPLTRRDVENRIAGTDISLQNLIDTDVLRPAGRGRYALAFNVVTREDMRLVREVADPAGASLAAAFLAERAAFDAEFARYDLPHVRRDVLALALVGCVVLDWDGLDVTAEDELRVPPVRKPNGDRFLMTMSEIAPDVSVRALYWGSHNATTDDGAMVLSTFGDHEAPRRLGFPDIVSHYPSATFTDHATSPDAARAIASIVRGAMIAERDVTGQIMRQLRAGPATADALGAQARTLRLLTALRYMRQDGDAFHTQVPVFTVGADSPMLDAVRDRGRRIMRTWLTQNYASLREQLAGLRALRAGVPYQVVFTQIWHDLFGWANNHLARDGFVYDPYGPDAEWVSFVPFVWEAPLRLHAGTRIYD